MKKLATILAVLALSLGAFAQQTYNPPTVYSGNATTGLIVTAGTVNNGGHPVAVAAVAVGTLTVTLNETSCAAPAYALCNFVYANSSGTVAVTTALPTAVASGNVLLALIETGATTITQIVYPWQVGTNWSAFSSATPVNAGVTIGLGAYQGTTAVPITDTAFHALIAAASDISLPANTVSTANRTIHVRGDGVYTNAAASLLNLEAMICTVSGCASGTVVTPTGCVVTTTNQANNLTNGQFNFDCSFVSTSTLGASGTFMAKATGCANLGAATTAVVSCFDDLGTAVSAAVNQTVANFLNIGFKFTTSNAGNSVTLLSASATIF